MSSCLGDWSSQAIHAWGTPVAGWFVPCHSLAVLPNEAMISPEK